ncbi:hypothetical protein [Picrophilus oshimae]|uniref:Hypothetical membrane spanning protein n=1 Tax=Picrophilus torridus (strain ATCC 700027 / DSM 9790 / JCM 10055 / NBRC 100828 / KAW 2/3) TaxID=1122961 RepID=Q6L2T3_PICTO|nr:hypothetical protein [Picrophilus oshimae]AAT42719.1 hypothetical membrane spanning protein [Picrophilus oshimae DSM 9789]
MNYKSGYLSLIIPLVAFIVAFLIPGILILDYVHVLLGVIWTGTDVFLGLIFFIVMSGMDDSIRFDISKRLIPMILFFIPGVSIITPLAGYELSLREHIFKFDILFILILIISLILVLLSLVFILRYALFINKSVDKHAVSLKMKKISIVASIQLVLQISIISLMAYIVVFI